MATQTKTQCPAVQQTPSRALPCGKRAGHSGKHEHKIAW